MSRIPEITHARLVTANVYYKLFGKLIKSPPHLKYFKTPVFKGPLFEKVIETPASLSLANSSCRHFFGFVKCPLFLKAIQMPPTLLVVSVT